MVLLIREEEEEEEEEKIEDFVLKCHVDFCLASIQNENPAFVSNDYQDSMQKTPSRVKQLAYRLSAASCYYQTSGVVSTKLSCPI